MSSASKKSLVDLGVLSPNMEVKYAQLEKRKKVCKNNKSLSKYVRYDDADFLRNLDPIKEDLKEIKNSYS